jgi:hypothetical protein
MEMVENKELAQVLHCFINEATAKEAGSGLEAVVYFIDVKNSQIYGGPNKGSLLIGFNGQYGECLFNEEGAVLLVFYAKKEEKLLVANGFKEFEFEAKEKKENTRGNMQITSIDYAGGFYCEKAPMENKKSNQPWPVYVYACKVNPDSILKDERGFYVPGKKDIFFEKENDLLFTSFEEAYKSPIDKIALRADMQIFSILMQKQI